MIKYSSLFALEACRYENTNKFNFPYTNTKVRPRKLSFITSVNTLYSVYTISVELSMNIMKNHNGILWIYHKTPPCFAERRCNKKIDFTLSFCLDDFIKRNCHCFSVTSFIVRIRNFQFFFPNDNLQIAKEAHIISGIVFCPDCLRI